MLTKLHITIRNIALVLALFGGGFALGAFGSTQVASAATVDVLPACSGGSDSKVCQDTDKDSLYKLIKNVVNMLITIVGIIAVIMIIIGGFRYATSAGDAGQTKSARDTIIYAVAGMVVAIMAFAIVNFVLANI